MTLGQIDAMPEPEFQGWREFYVLYPFDDLHRYHRPAALVATSFGGGDINDRIGWLMPDPVAGDFDDADLRTMKALGLTPPRA